jgi:chlorophyll/bacteriochlorophyll a synthase
VLGLGLAWLYSAPPVRLKRNGWWGNLACAFSYEGLAWITGGVVMALGAFPDSRSVWLAVLYSLGAHGIMTLNDFKSVVGDRQMGIGSLPVRLGVDRAAVVASWAMAVPQVVVIGLLVAWGQGGHALAVAALLAAQGVMMVWFCAQPVQRALFYSGFGVPLYVGGMLVSAFALRAAGS